MMATALALVTTLVVSHATLSFAFTASHPATTRPSTRHYVIDPRNEIGVVAPVGYFDPLGFIENGPYGDRLDNFRHYRGIEVKHGRIAMAATLGMLVQENYHFTGYLSPDASLRFTDVPNGLAACRVVPLLGWVQMAVVIGLHELIVQERPGHRAPGDFGTGYFGVALNDQGATQLRALTVEVQNGRLAMLGILGMFASEVIHKEALWEVHVLFK